MDSFILYQDLINRMRNLHQIILEDNNSGPSREGHSQEGSNSQAGNNLVSSQAGS